MTLNGYSFILAITKELSMVRSRLLFNYEIIVFFMASYRLKKDGIESDRGWEQNQILSLGKSSITGVSE